MRIGPFLLLLAILVTGCGGGGSGPEPEPPPPTTSAPPVGNDLPGPRPSVAPRPYVNFESGQVRPIALSRDGAKLFAVNTPAAELEVYAVAAGLTLQHSIPVGLEPVAVGEDPGGRVWVVNHLSDSVSIVDVNAIPPRVSQTLWVGDEPRDIVFAGASGERAFITTAHRGQNSPVDPAMDTPGIGRADVWVFDSDVGAGVPGGAPLDIVTLFGDRPRPLAVSADGLSVYAGIFLSGNRTTTLAPNNFSKAPPTTSADSVQQPDTGIIVRYNGSSWVDEQGAIFDGGVPFELPDYDVFEIDAQTLSVQRRLTGVGTILFNMVASPTDDTLFVSNLQSRNHVRFSGVASRASTTVRGRIADQRITVIDDTGVRPRVLNKHLDFSANAWSQQDRELSVSLPLDMAITADGNMLYATAFGSCKIVGYQTGKLRDDTFEPVTSSHIPLSGCGPSGIVLDEDNDRAFVLTRFDNGISIIDLATSSESSHVQMFNPEPGAVRDGRRFLYDAAATSGNGNDSCASCHIFGDTDGLAWDLGEPDGTMADNPNMFIPISPPATPWEFHPMKGPMATQSMRGLAGHGPMHWRGDRTGANRLGGETLEEAAFKEFNAAFDALAALGTTLDDAEMQSFTDFAMTISYPPNPLRRLDNGLDPLEARGRELFDAGVVRVQTGQLEVCVQCHTLDPAAGLFGTKGLSSDNSQTGERNFKIPHFRDQYQKVGMFGWSFNAPPATGPQVRGFSFNHNGATSSNFIIADLGMPQDDLQALRAFLYRFPTESPPVTGQSVTLTAANHAAAGSRVDLLIERAEVDTPVPECDLVATGVVGGIARRWLFTDSQTFKPDSSAEAPVSRAGLEALLEAPDDSISLVCVPWGSGERLGLDRDLDGTLNRD